MTILSRAMFVATVAVMASACGGSKAATTEPAHQSVSHQGAGPHGAMCPMKVAGTQVSVEDTSDGVAKVFTTTGDVAELRRRVHHMAEMHEQMSQDHPMEARPGMGAGPMGGHKHMMGDAVPATARAEDVDRGARLNLTPKDPAKLAELRAHVRDHAARMANGQCPMMQEHH